MSKQSIVRTRSAGVFAGEVVDLEGTTATVKGARRLWYWAGAASLSELAVKGVSRPSQCKFPCAVPQVTLTEVIEIIPLSDEAKATIDGVPEWTAH